MPKFVYLPNQGMWLNLCAVKTVNVVGKSENGGPSCLGLRLDDGQSVFAGDEECGVVLRALRKFTMPEK